MERRIIQTHGAPNAIGNYSQAVRAGATVYFSGQIPLDPETMLMPEGIEAQIHRVFQNLKAVIVEAGGRTNDIVKLNVYLTDLGHFALVNDIMTSYFTPPYPARAVVGVASLPRSAVVEMDAVMVLPNS